MWKEVLLVTDAECKGNPGDTILHCYYEIHNGDKTISRGKTTGIAQGTNNEGEYLAVLYGLTAVVDTMVNAGLAPTQFKLNGVSDSQVVVKQVNGEYRVNAENLLPYHEMVMNLLPVFHTIEYQWCSRDIVNAYLGLD